ncbi:MAG TPA: alkaline phosphatase family protein [Rhizomicrobium sp.]|nr:alkaline phosphatase family protein [Rhizomicrobium sp.]
MKSARPLAAALLFALALLPAAGQARPAARPPQVTLLFVADGLRYDSVTQKSAPTLWRVKRTGVDFADSHALYPTITTVNASAIATGHYIGDTGNFGNALFTGVPMNSSKGLPIAGMENDPTLAEMNARFGGNYLNETSLLAAARDAGFATAALGKVGPTSIQDVTQRDGTGTVVIDDAVGTPQGLPIPADLAAAITAAGLPATAPETAVPNGKQQQYLVAVATKVVLPRLLRTGKPVMMVFWSRDPDASQHVEKDGSINGPTGLAGIKDADDALAALLAGLKADGVGAPNVFVTADHGFSTIDNMDGGTALAPGFLAADVAAALGLPNRKGAIGNDPKKPDAIVVPNGGSDLIYLFGAGAWGMAAKIAAGLAAKPYAGAIFANDALGDVPGTLKMSAVNLRGSALTPQPSMVVGFASHVMAGCKPLLMCVAEFADTPLVTGQGMHGTFSRADTRNFMAAMGPAFRKAFVDRAPVGNADIAPTLAQILGLTIAPKGGLTGRPATEALAKGHPVAVARGWIASTAPLGDAGKQFLEYQQVGSTRYFDAAGIPARTVGLSAH